MTARKRCPVPPPGWFCTRDAGHEGPCAAWPSEYVVAEYVGAEWADKPLPEEAEIRAAHPCQSGRHDLYAEALRLVGAKRSKFGLVCLVAWLLLRAEKP